MVMDREQRGGGLSNSKDRKSSQDKSSPEWADGLRSLYDSVVDEPLPDSFKDLLAKLDEDGSEKPTLDGSK